MTDIGLSGGSGTSFAREVNYNTQEWVELGEFIVPGTSAKDEDVRADLICNCIGRVHENGMPLPDIWTKMRELDQSHGRGTEGFIQAVVDWSKELVPLEEPIRMPETAGPVALPSRSPAAPRPYPSTGLEKLCFGKDMDFRGEEFQRLGEFLVPGDSELDRAEIVCNFVGPLVATGVRSMDEVWAEVRASADVHGQGTEGHLRAVAAWASSAAAQAVATMQI